MRRVEIGKDETHGDWEIKDLEIGDCKEKA